MATTHAQAAQQQAYDTAVGEFARQLATYSNLIPSLYPEEAGFRMPPPSDEAAYRRMAQELLEKKKTTVTGADGRTIEISIDSDDPNSLDARDTRHRDGLFKKTLGVDNLNNLASQSSVQAFSAAIGDAVDKNSSDIGFLRGASIGNVLEGLMRWITSFFTGEKTGGLIETIATVTAENIHQDTVKNLLQLRGQRPEMAGMLSDEAIRQAADGAYFATLEKAGFPSPHAPERNSSFAGIKPFTVSDADVAAARNTIYNRIMNPTEGASLADAIAQKSIESRDASFLGRNFGPSDEKLQAGARRMANVIASTIASRATNTDTAERLSQMRREEYANYMADEVATALKENKRRMDLPYDLNEERLNGIRTAVYDKMLENYDQISQATHAAAMNSQQHGVDNAQVVAAAQGARNAGMGNMVDTDIITVQPGASGGRSTGRTA